MTISSFLSQIIFVLFVALLAQACDSGADEEKLIDTRSEWREVTQARQALGTSWTGPWGSNAQGVSGVVGTRGTVGGNWLYNTMNATLQGSHKYYDDNATWTTGLTPSPGTQLGRPAVTQTKVPSGGGAFCDLVAWRNSTNSQMVWQVETGGIGSYCELNAGLSAAAQVSGAIYGAPAIASWENGLNQIYLAVAAKNSGNCPNAGTCLQFTTYSHANATGGSFAAWTERTDGALKPDYSPDAISITPNRADIFVVGTDSTVYARTVTMSLGILTWGGWLGLGGYSYSSPSVASKSATGMKMCIIGSDFNIQCNTYTNGSWSGFSSCGSPTGFGASDVEVATDGTDYWVFAIGPSQVYARVCN